MPTLRSAVAAAFAVTGMLCPAISCVSYYPPAPAPTVPPIVSVGAASAISEEIVTRTNAERRALGLSTLGRSSQLMQAAQLQAEQMALTEHMSHDSPGARYPYPVDRLAAVGYLWRASAENVAEGYSDAAGVMTGWMNSKGHRANIVSDLFTEMGAGEAVGKNGRRYFAQVFGAPRGNP